MNYHVYPRIAFIHIPKTGGSSLKDTFKLIADWNLIEDRPGEKIRKNRDFSQKLIVWGHLSYRQIAERFGPALYISIIRDPVERLIGHYEWRRVMGEHEGKEPLEWIKERIKTSQQFMFFGNTMQDAKNVFHRLAWIGCFDRLDQDLEWFFEAIGAEGVRIQRSNDNPGKQVFSESFKKTVSELIPEDVEFYQWAYDIRLRSLQR